MQEPVKKICDNCIHYNWYWDKCNKYNCEIDARSVCSDHQFKEEECDD